LHLGQEIDRILLSAIRLGMALLAAVPADFADGQPIHANALQCGFDIIELERLNDRLYLLHRVSFGASRLAAILRSASSSRLPPRAVTRKVTGRTCRLSCGAPNPESTVHGIRA